jgi:periplasmic mercuric ion binding protein
MKKFVVMGLLGLSLLTSAAAIAAPKIVTLAVPGMYCATCPITVKGSLTAVPGVSKVEVSLARKTATVTFDDAKTNIPALIAATTNAGYPSTLAH